MTSERTNHNLPPSVRVDYASYFNTHNPLFTLRINPFTCGALMREMGVRDAKISTSIITVSASPSDNNLGKEDRFNMASEYKEAERTVHFYPTDIWNHGRVMAARIQLLRTGESKTDQIKMKNNRIQVDSHSRKIVNQEEFKMMEGLTRKDMQLFMGAKKTEGFFAKLNGTEEDPEGALAMIGEESRRALRESLAYGIYKMAHPLSEALGEHAMIYLAAFVSATAAVSSESYWLQDKLPLLGLAALTTFTALASASYSYRAISDINMKRRERNARQFARSVSTNRKWDSLVTTEIGWIN